MPQDWMPEEPVAEYEIEEEDEEFEGESVSPRRRWTAFFLCLFLGAVGAHRFYTGKLGTGILYILTAGFLGIGVLIDLFRIGFGRFRDADQRLLAD
ncbi:MAG: TM2 domain-containing protein [Clostridiales bacterium]|nr:TM2 domain-containing protein [Clostridiales bacterium]